MYASTFPSARRRLPSSGGWIAQAMSFRGSRPTWAAIAETKMSPALCNAQTATVLPLRSSTARMRGVPNSSKQPTWIPAKRTMGSCASMRRRSGPLNAVLKWILPVARSRHCAAPISADLTYFTLVNPSPSSSSSATNCGAAQRLGLSPIRSVVVSGGDSASAEGTPSRRAMPTAAAPCTNARRPIIPSAPSSARSGTASQYPPR
jgi:hypothetical protein